MGVGREEVKRAKREGAKHGFLFSAHGSEKKNPIGWTVDFALPARGQSGVRRTKSGTDKGISPNKNWTYPLSNT